MEQPEKKAVQLFTLEQYAKHLYTLLSKYVHTSTVMPAGFPVSRGTYYKLGKGVFPTKYTITNICNWLKMPEPKILF